MDVNHAGAREAHRRGELPGSDGAQAVGRHPDARARERAHRGAAALHDARKALRVVEEALLPPARRRAAEAAVRVEGRQQRESDPGGGRRRSYTPGELGRVGVRGAVAIVVQVMKLTDMGEPSFEHLGVGECGQRLELLRVDALDEAVHEVAPGPEAIATRSAALGEAGEAALEGVTVEVAEPGECDPVSLIAGAGSNV